jgi:hypothetical protein
MELPTTKRDDVVKWVTDGNDKILEDSIRCPLHSICHICAEFETNSSDMVNVIVTGDFEEEGMINTHGLFLHVPKYSKSKDILITLYK